MAIDQELMEQNRFVTDRQMDRQNGQKEMKLKVPWGSGVWKLINNVSREGLM